MWILLCLLPAVSAANNRCVGADGKVSYQDAACPSTARDARRLELAENTLEGRPYMPPARLSVGSAATFDDAIKLRCGADWPGNTRMQEFCQRKQVDAWRQSQQAIDASPEIAATIRLRCEREYPDDYRMRAACVRVEAAAAKRYGR